MVVKFGANILSQSVQRHLGRTTLDLASASERLASGQRINKASDDAAGLAIASTLRADTRIFAQGVRNLNDGLSAVNVAEGAMVELTGILGRLEELAAQSINDTYSNKQRESLQREASALTAEWNRIVESTQFNGQALLTGSTTRTVLQAGKGTDGTLAIQFGRAANPNAGESIAGTTTRVSVNSSGAEANDYSLDPSISASGHH